MNAPGRERRLVGGRRVELSQQACLVWSDGVVADVRLRDISRGGFRIRHDGLDIVVGDMVVIKSDQGSASKGQILWATDCEVGGAFVDLPVHFH